MDNQLEQTRRLAEESVRAAYAAGRISVSEYDRRLGVVALAGSPTEVNQVFDRLVRRPSVVSVVPYLTGFFGPFGPGTVYWLAAPGTPMRRSAVYALNLQFGMFFIGLGTAIIGFATGSAWVFALLTVEAGLFFLVTLVSVVVALGGRPIELPPHPKWQNGWSY